jgi:hypothetical protein
VVVSKVVLAGLLGLPSVVDSVLDVSAELDVCVAVGPATAAMIEKTVAVTMPAKARVTIGLRGPPELGGVSGIFTGRGPSN